MIRVITVVRNTDVENKHIDTRVGKRVAINWEMGIDIFTLLLLLIRFSCV